MRISRMGGVPGRAERPICVNLRSFAVNFRSENGDLDRKWTRMDANGGGERPRTVIFSRKTGKGHKNRMGRAGNYEIREKHEKWA